MLNLSSLFFTTVDGEACMHASLDLSQDERDAIAHARKEVRACLRAGIPRVLRENGYPGTVPEPRFFTQGSWAYKTLNSPAKRPQQADVDDGCYLPLGFVAQSQRPSAATTVFFAAAEEALLPLVAARRWRMDRSKATCIRVIISDYAHIDIPLYAIPDEEFTQLALATENYGFDSVAKAVSVRSRDSWTALPKNKVLLAHREENWLPSDPRPVKDWFLGQVDANGEQFRRVVRYLKAYRDWRWASGGPSSILLMAAAAPIFEKRDRRDDLALLDVVAQLPAHLRGGVCNPVEESESLTKRLGAEKVEEAAQAFESFEKVLRATIAASNAAQGCAWMRGEFGARFPDEPERVKATTIAQTIMAAPAAAGPSELVGRTMAG
jgi:hypothetical protein